jgi:hypothetical protein
VGEEAQPRSREGSRRRAGRTPAIALLALVLPLVLPALTAMTAACSLLIDFGAYRPSADADAGDADTLDASGDASDDGGSCDGSDRMTDPDNCGLCGHACNEGAGSCDAGRCPLTPLFDEDGGAVQALVLPTRPDGGAYLYFTTADAFVGRRSLADGTIEKSATTGAAAHAVAVNALGTLGVAAIGPKTIEKFDTPLFTTQPLASVSTDHLGLDPLWLSGSEVFWGDNEGVWWSSTTADAGASGGPDAGSAPPVAFAELGATVVWLTAAGDVFSTDASSPGKVMRLVSGGNQTFTCMAVSRTYLYLCEKTALGGGLVVYAVANLSVPLRTIALSDPQAVVADAQYVYVVDYRTKLPNDSRLLRAKADGTQLLTLADGFRSSRGLALDEQWIYFGDGPRILRTSR